MRASVGGTPWSLHKQQLKKMDVIQAEQLMVFSSYRQPDS